MRLACVFATIIAGLLAATAAAQQAPVAGYEVLLPETQALQNDDFANPGMLWVELGEDLWSQEEANGQSCQSCHDGRQTMRAIGTPYPPVSEAEDRTVNLEPQFDRCRTGRQEEPAF